MPATEKHEWLRLDSAVLALGITAFAYAVAFMYEVGYVGYFGVPFMLVEVSIRTLFRSVSWLLLIAITVVVLCLATMMVFRDSKAKVPVLVWAPMVAAIFFAALGLRFDLSFYFALSGPCLFLPLVYLASPLISNMKKKGSYAEKLHATDEIVRSRIGNDPHRAEILLWAGFVLIPLISLRVAHDTGLSEAHEQTTFLVADATPPCVVIRAYGDFLICVEYAGARPLGKFRLLRKEDYDREFTLERIGSLGPLAVEPDSLVE